MAVLASCRRAGAVASAGGYSGGDLGYEDGHSLFVCFFLFYFCSVTVRKGTIWSNS